MREEPGKRLSFGMSYAASIRICFQVEAVEPCPPNRATWLKSSSLRYATSSEKRGHGGLRLFEKAKSGEPQAVPVRAQVRPSSRRLRFCLAAGHSAATIE